jgi:hypothetical protein
VRGSGGWGKGTAWRNDPNNILTYEQMIITKEEQKDYHIKHMKSGYRKKIINFPIIN